MRIKKFVGKNFKEALEMVKKELAPMRSFFRVGPLRQVLSVY